MKLFICSDIHGSLTQAQKAVEIYKESQADYFICLGDLYYHGPRNKLPESYAPRDVANLLNTIKERVIAIKGNCDAEVDQMISEFPIHENMIMMDEKGHRFFFHHGHHEVIFPTSYDVIFSGHTHIAVLEKKEDGVIYANPGSISLPKAEKSQGYFIVENGKITHYDINTREILHSIIIE